MVIQIGREHDAQWRTLDRSVTRHAAEYDPTTFVQEDGMLVIDEIQRVPELLLAIKEAVDADQRPGRFLLTGSAKVLALRSVPDALPGRVETIELWPLSQGEIDERPDGFVDGIFNRGPELRHISEEHRDSYIAPGPGRFSGGGGTLWAPSPGVVPRSLEHLRGVARRCSVNIASRESSTGGGLG